MLIESLFLILFCSFKKSSFFVAVCDLAVCVAVRVLFFFAVPRVGL